MSPSYISCIFVPLVLLLQPAQADTPYPSPSTAPDEPLPGTFVTADLKNVWSVDHGGVYDTAAPGLELVNSSYRASECYATSSSWDSVHLTEEITTTPSDNPWATVTDFSTIIPWRSAPYTLLGNAHTKNPSPCCGSCYLRWAGVNVFYWPEHGVNVDCTTKGVMNNMPAFFNDVNAFHTWSYHGPPQLAPSSTLISNLSSTITRPAKRAEATAIPHNGTVVMDGQTYVSPSVYFKIPILEAADDCDFVGPQITNFRTSYHPTQISSMVANSVDCWGHALLWAIRQPPTTLPGCTFATQSFNFNDLPCPPEALRAQNDNSFIWDPISSYAPMLAPMSDLISVDPHWEHCTVLPGWDPYTNLIAFDTMLANPQPKHTRPAEPGATIASPGPTPSSAWIPSEARTMPSVSEPKKTAEPEKIEAPAHESEHSTDISSSLAVDEHITDPEGLNQDPTTTAPTTSSHTSDHESGQNSQQPHEPEDASDTKNGSIQDPTTNPTTSPQPTTTKNGQGVQKPKEPKEPKHPSSSEDIRTQDLVTIPSPADDPSRSKHDQGNHVSIDHSNTSKDEDQGSQEPSRLHLSSVGPTTTRDILSTIGSSPTLHGNYDQDREQTTTDNNLEPGPEPTSDAKDEETFDMVVAKESSPGSKGDKNLDHEQTSTHAGTESSSETDEFGDSDTVSQGETSAAASSDTNKSTGIAQMILSAMMGEPIAAGQTKAIDRAPPQATFDGDIITASEGSFIIKGSPYHAGITATISGTAVTLPALQTSTTPAVVVQSKTYTADDAGNFVISGSSFRYGDTIKGMIETTVPHSVASTPTVPAVVVQSKTYTADELGDFVISGSSFRYVNTVASMTGKVPQVLVSAIRTSGNTMHSSTLVGGTLPGGGDIDQLNEHGVSTDNHSEESASPTVDGAMSNNAGVSATTASGAVSTATSNGSNQETAVSLATSTIDSCGRTVLWLAVLLTIARCIA